MKYRQQAEADALARAQGYLDENADTFATVNASADRATLDDVIAKVGAQQVSQSVGRAGAKAKTVFIRQTCVSLRLDHMQPIATIARAKLSAVPEACALTVPDCRMNAPQLLGVAAAMATAIEPYVQTLVDAGLQPDCVDQLRSVIATINAAISDRAMDRIRWIEATADIQAQIARGRQAVTVLDAVVVSQSKGNANLLAAWRVAKRVTQKPGPSRQTATTQS